MAGWIGCVLLLGLYGVLFVLGTRRKSVSSRRYVPRDVVTPFEEGIRELRLAERLAPVLQRPRLWLAVLEGGACPPERLLRWTAESAAMAYAAGTGCWLLAALSGNLGIAGMGTLIACCMPALRARDLQRRVEARRLAILRELPVMLSRMLVLVNAGENALRALARSAEGRAEGRHPLYDELRAALAAMERGESLSLAMEEFGRRCAVPEVQLFAAVLLMNARRGGEELVPALRDLNRQMWEKRKAVARTLGEQASSRLAFPLALIFLLIVVLVGAPALLNM